MNTALDRLNGPCTWGTPAGPCGDTNSRPYQEGPRCRRHAPWARRGRPEPGHHLKTTNNPKGGQPA